MFEYFEYWNVSRVEQHGMVYGELFVCKRMKWILCPNKHLAIVKELVIIIIITIIDIIHIWETVCIYDAHCYSIETFCEEFEICVSPLLHEFTNLLLYINGNECAIVLLQCAYATKWGREWVRKIQIREGNHRCLSIVLSRDNEKTTKVPTTSAAVKPNAAHFCRHSTRPIPCARIGGMYNMHVAWHIHPI